MKLLFPQNLQIIGCDCLALITSPEPVLKLCMCVQLQYAGSFIVLKKCFMLYAHSSAFASVAVSLLQHSHIVLQPHL